MMKTRM